MRIRVHRGVAEYVGLCAKKKYKSGCVVAVTMWREAWNE